MVMVPARVCLVLAAARQASGQVCLLAAATQAAAQTFRESRELPRTVRARAETRHVSAEAT
jgi:hypothetical protein